MKMITTENLSVLKTGNYYLEVDGNLFEGTIDSRQFSDMVPNNYDCTILEQVTVIWKTIFETLKGIHELRFTNHGFLLKIHDSWFHATDMNFTKYADKVECWYIEFVTPLVTYRVYMPVRYRLYLANQEHG
ncbi:MAG: hypothetical protein ACFFD4_12870 [Candidatus Odinarchaeota archaeon]